MEKVLIDRGCAVEDIGWPLHHGRRGYTEELAAAQIRPHDPHGKVARAAVLQHVAQAERAQSHRDGRSQIRECFRMREIVGLTPVDEDIVRSPGSAVHIRIGRDEDQLLDEKLLDEETRPMTRGVDDADVQSPVRNGDV